MTYQIERIGENTRATVDTNGKRTRQHTLQKRIQSTEFVDTWTAQQQLGIVETQPHPTDPLAVCRGITTKLDPSKRDPWYYDVTIEYSTETPDSNQEDRQRENPMDDPVEIVTDAEVIMIPLTKDLDDQPIVNAANDPILGLEREQYVETVTFTRNEPTRNSTRDRAFRGRINKNAWSGAAPGTLKIRRISSTRQYRNRIPFYKYTYEMAYDADGWEKPQANLGKYQLIDDPENPGEKIRVPCLDDQGNEVSDPVPLDDNGLQIPTADLPDAQTELTFTTLPEAEFEDLGLPTY